MSQQTGPTLHQELGTLLPSTASQLWRAAVGRAGQLLAPAWSVQPAPAALGVLAALLYAAAATSDRSPQQIPPAELVELLDRAPDLDGEPAAARELLHRGLDAAGHPVGDRTDAASRATARALFRSEPADVPLALGGGVAGPSALRYAAPRLRAAFAGLTEQQLLDLPVVQPELSTIGAVVTGTVRVVSKTSQMPLACSTCRRADGGTLKADGDLVEFVCRKGHTTTDHRLSAPHVRAAFRRSIGLDGFVRGDLFVVRGDLPADADPHELCTWLRALV